MIIDIRDRPEYQKGKLVEDEPQMNIPYHQLKYQLDLLKSFDEVVFICTNGTHSMKQAYLMNKHEGINAKYRRP